MKYEFNYVEPFIYIRSNWFDEDSSIIEKIGHKGYFLYLNLFRFLIKNQQDPYLFVTSIQNLKNCTGLKPKEIFELIQLLYKEKIIETNNRWELWFEDRKRNGKLKINEMIIIKSISYPLLVRNDENKLIPASDSSDDKYIAIDTRLMQLYQDYNFDYPYYSFFALINKWSNGREAKVDHLGINKISEILCCSEHTVVKIIENLNKHYLLCSNLRKNKKGVKRYEHKILNNYNNIDEFIYANKKIIDKNFKK